MNTYQRHRFFIKRDPTIANQRMESNPYVEIIILNYNGANLLREYLPTIADLEYSNFGITIVDNNSTDKSVQFIRENYPNIKIIENQENRGFSEGNNIGAASNKEADYYWFLNSDVRVESDSLTILVEYIKNRKNTGIVCPKVLEMDSQDSIQSVGYEYNIFGMVSARLQGEDCDKINQPQEVSYPAGAALLIKKSVWDEIGGFDEVNFIYGDDTYLGLSSWLRGYRVIAVPDSVVYHEEGSSQSEDIAPFIAYHNARSRTRVYFALLERSTLFVGISGFIVHSMIRIVKDVFVRNSITVAIQRFMGYMSICVEMSELLEFRKEIQRQRKIRDCVYIKSLW